MTLDRSCHPESFGCAQGKLREGSDVKLSHCHIFRATDRAKPELLKFRGGRLIVKWRSPDADRSQFHRLGVGQLKPRLDYGEYNSILASPRGHLITLSALASTFGGIVTPICLAVFKLMMSSNFVGCSTGRSAGLAPFRILST